LTIGYSRIQAQSRVANFGLPAGMAIYSLRQNGNLISEASVQAAPLISSGRVYAEISGPVNTGIAIANPNSQAVTISFYFTDGLGNNFGQGSTNIEGNHQISMFLNESPFNVSGDVHGTFTFSSSALVSVIAIRGFKNERGEFLMTTLPVSPIGNLYAETVTIPHFAIGGGWRTSVVLVNPSDKTITGKLRTYAQSADPMTVTLDGTASDSFDYWIPPSSSMSFRSTGANSNIQVGSLDVIPDSAAASRPSAMVIFRYSNNGVTVTESGVLAGWSTTGIALSMFVESTGQFGDPGSVESGIAIRTNGTGNIDVHIIFELYRFDGTMIGSTPSITVPARWQTSLFLHEIPGLPTITPPFQGVLRVFSWGDRFSPPTVSATGLRGRYNERGDFLISTTAPIAEVYATDSSELLFPHFVIGGGYHTQFVLFSDQGATGTMYLLDNNGNPLSLSLK
jgi:hypothetical protein